MMYMYLYVYMDMYIYKDTHKHDLQLIETARMFVIITV